jgi:glycerol kinase
MEADSGIALKALNVDGGMVVNNLLMQFQADMLQVQVQRPEVNETTALGAAYAAGLATGFWKNLDDLRQNHRVSKIWQPHMAAEKVEKFYAGWKKAVERSMGWV